LLSFKKLASNRIELLAPARDLETGRVAVDSGADAVYIGGPGFGARRAAGNSLEDIAALVRYARPFGVRVYATLNTLLFDDELAEAEEVARGLLAAGVDALIVQDMAFLRMGLGAVEFHASTQTFNAEPSAVAFLGRAGFRRVILERALSVEEIRAIRAAVPEEVELEAFIHGALCVGYSGRCFMSLASGGGRSGNRGDCSQPCRLAYDLVDGAGNVVTADGKAMKGKHLLSLRDLDLSARVGELLDAGVTSFKIEGRLKDAAYVRNVVSHYRRLIDRAIAKHGAPAPPSGAPCGLQSKPKYVRASVGRSVPDFEPNPAKSFTRGASEYFFEGTGAGVASFDTPKAIGEAIGRVERVDCERTGNRFFTLAASPVAADLAPGDGICFFSRGELRGTSVNRVEANRIYPNDTEGIAPGVDIYRNHDHTFARTLERSRMRRRIGATASVATSPTTLEATFTDETAVSATVARSGEFPPANNHAQMAATLREQLSKSGDTIFEVSRVEVLGARFIPVSMLAQLRREGLERLFEARAALPPMRHPATEDPTACAPRTRLAPDDNVTNHLAERFWRDHGVTEIDPPMELRGATAGDVVMRTRYCIRREIGACLRESTSPGGEMFLQRGTTRWRLAFDCANCIMEIKKI
jgi:putative protease